MGRLNALPRSSRDGRSAASALLVPRTAVECLADREPVQGGVRRDACGARGKDPGEAQARIGAFLAAIRRQGVIADAAYAPVMS